MNVRKLKIRLPSFVLNFLRSVLNPNKYYVFSFLGESNWGCIFRENIKTAKKVLLAISEIFLYMQLFLGSSYFSYGNSEIWHYSAKSQKVYKFWEKKFKFSLFPLIFTIFSQPPSPVILQFRTISVDSSEFSCFQFPFWQDESENLLFVHLLISPCLRLRP